MIEVQQEQAEEFRLGRNLQLTVDVATMGFDRWQRNTQVERDRIAAVPDQDKLCNLAFTGSQDITAEIMKPVLLSGKGVFCVEAEASQRKPDVEIKQNDSFVTTTDKAVEAALREMIRDTYPDHGILGEEFENTNIDAEFVWVLDPIDGTAAFVAGIPVYGSLIGLALYGAPFVGVIEHPMTSDRWIGVANRLARFNGDQIRIRPCASMERAYATCSNRDFMSGSEPALFDRVRERVQYVQYGGSCYSYGVLASGRVDLALDGGLDAFDIYAPATVFIGAGGFVTDWNGGALTVDMKGNVLAAGDKARLDEALAIMQG